MTCDDSVHADIYRRGWEAGHADGLRLTGEAELPLISEYARHYDAPPLEVTGNAGQPCAISGCGRDDTAFWYVWDKHQRAWLCPDHALALQAEKPDRADGDAGHPSHCIVCDSHLDDPYHGPEPCLLCPHAFPHHEFKPVPGDEVGLEPAFTQDDLVAANLSAGDEARRANRAEKQLSELQQAVQAVVSAWDGASWEIWSAEQEKAIEAIDALRSIIPKGVER